LKLLPVLQGTGIYGKEIALFISLFDSNWL
jgi:hypothetical protein